MHDLVCNKLVDNQIVTKFRSTGHLAALITGLMIMAPSLSVFSIHEIMIGDAMQLGCQIYKPITPNEPFQVAKRLSIKRTNSEQLPKFR